MANEKCQPGVDNTEQAEVQIGGLTDSSVSGACPIPASRPGSKIGATVEKALDAALWRLCLGEIGLENLTPALLGFWSVGHDDGYKAGFTEGAASIAIELAQAEADRDRYYRIAFTTRPPVKVGQSYAELQATRAKTYRGEK